MRLSLGAALIDLGFASLSGKPVDAVAVIEHLASIAGGIFLFAGLWTPVIGGLLALDQLYIAFSLYSPIHIFLAVLCVSLSTLGPGAWSIDARLFGRKRFHIDRTRRSL